MPKPAVVFAVAATLAVFSLTACRPDARDTFIARCKLHIERQLRSPGSATYGNIHTAGLATTVLDRQGYHSSDGKTFWFATVDAPNAFGTAVRSYVLCADLPTGFEAMLTSDPSLLTGWLLTR
jgi:hypothetical protein